MTLWTFFDQKCDVLLQQSMRAMLEDRLLKTMAMKHERDAHKDFENFRHQTFFAYFFCDRVGAVCVAVGASFCMMDLLRWPIWRTDKLNES